MEDLDVEERSNSDEEVTFPHKKKLNSFLSESDAFPIKDSRIKKVNKNVVKSITHGRQLLRNRLRFNKTLNNCEKRTTRFSSKSSDSNSNEGSDLVKKNVIQDLAGPNIKGSNDKNPTNVPERRPTRQRITRVSESQSNVIVESQPEQPKTRKNSGKCKVLSIKL
jgi:hypothetical protein